LMTPTWGGCYRKPVPNWQSAHGTQRPLRFRSGVRFFSRRPAYSPRRQRQQSAQLSQQKPITGGRYARGAAAAAAHFERPFRATTCPRRDSAGWHVLAELLLGRARGAWGNSARTGQADSGARSPAVPARIAQKLAILRGDVALAIPRSDGIRPRRGEDIGVEEVVQFRHARHRS